MDQTNVRGRVGEERKVSFGKFKKSFPISSLSGRVITMSGWHDLKSHSKSNLSHPRVAEDSRGVVGVPLDMVT